MNDGVEGSETVEGWEIDSEDDDKMDTQSDID
jgi:hypothetical protein